MTDAPQPHQWDRAFDRARRETLLAIGLTASAGIVAGALFFFQFKENRLLAASLSPLIDAEPVRNAKLGAIVEEGTIDSSLIFDPGMWSAAHYLRRSTTPLLNSPWLHVGDWFLTNARPQLCQNMNPLDISECLRSADGTSRPPLDVLVGIAASARPLAGGLSETARIAQMYGLTRVVTETPVIAIYARPQ